MFRFHKIILKIGNRKKQKKKYRTVKLTIYSFEQNVQFIF